MKRSLLSTLMGIDPDAAIVETESERRFWAEAERLRRAKRLAQVREVVDALAVGVVIGLALCGIAWIVHFAQVLSIIAAVFKCEQ